MVFVLEYWTGGQTITGQTRHLLTPVRRLQQTGAPSIRPSLARRVISFIYMKLRLIQADLWVNQLYIQTLSREQHVICLEVGFLNHNRGHHTVISDN